MNISILFQNILPFIMAINVNWSGITDGISRLFTGGYFTDPQTNVTQFIPGVLGSNMTIVAVFVFLFFFILVGLFGMTMLIGSVVIIPVLFFLFQYVPPLRIIVAIVIGFIFGIGLHRLIRR